MSQEQLENRDPQIQKMSQLHNNLQKENENASLIQALKQTPNYLQQKFNEKLKSQNPSKPVRAGGVYVPPHRLRAMQQQMMKKQALGGIENQRMMWQLLRKSINGIVNKVNISNIQNIVVQLFNQNILRGKGLLSKSIIKAQMASPNFSHVYAALISVINTKLPEIGNLIIKRVMIQFKRAFQRNNKIVCIATTKMIAHLINQRVLGQYAGLQLLFILLNKPSEASVQIACDFMIQAGQVLSEITPAGANAIFERFKTLLHEGEINQKAQYSIQNLFAIRKTGFKQHPGVIPQLDLVQAQDQITHNMDFQDDMKAEQNLNIFKFDPFYQKTEQEWDSIKLQILGQQNIINLKQMHNYEQQMMQQQQQQQQQQIQDLTEQDLINMRRTIYLVIQSTVNFEQCAHKLLKMNIAKGYQHELVDMIIQCCMMQRIYQTFFGLLAERFCLIDDLYKELFIKAFINHYNAIFKLQVNKIRNIGRLFGHLLYRFAIDWRIFQVIVLKPQTTTAAGRMFLKILFKEVSENLGMERTIAEFNKQQMRQYYQGLFPIDHPNNLRFSINYFTSIGLGPLTQNMREILQMQQEIIMSRKQKQQEEILQQQLKQQEELLRLMEQEQMQRMKQLNQIELQRKKKNQEIQNKLKEKQKKQYLMKKNQQKRKKQSSSSSSSSSSSISSSGSSSSSSEQKYKGSKTPKRKKSKTPQKRKEIPQKKRRQSNSPQKNQKNQKNIVQITRKIQSPKIEKERERERSRQKLKPVQIKKQSKRQKSVSSDGSNQYYWNQKKSGNQKRGHEQKNKDKPLQKEKRKQKFDKKLRRQTKFDKKRKDSDSQSSGISSFSSGDSSDSDESHKQRRKQKNKNKRMSSSESSSSSSSSRSSVDTYQLYRRKIKKQGKI